MIWLHGWLIYTIYHLVQKLPLDRSTCLTSNHISYYGRRNRSELKILPSAKRVGLLGWRVRSGIRSILRFPYDRGVMQDRKSNSRRQTMTSTSCTDPGPDLGLLPRGLCQLAYSADCYVPGSRLASPCILYLYMYDAFRGAH